MVTVAAAVVVKSDFLPEPLFESPVVAVGVVVLGESGVVLLRTAVDDARVGVVTGVVSMTGERLV